jgi:hypothetical protein
LGFNKKVLYEAYKEEKKMRKEAHDKAEAEMLRAIEDVKLESVSGLAEEMESQVTKIQLETFSRPKVSRRQRRASLGMTLRILTPPASPTLNLEDIKTVDPVPSSPLPVAPLEIDRRSMLKKSLSCKDAETLAGWRTVTFADGPLGLRLEPTVGEKAARVTGFIDSAGLPSAARATGQIDFNDVIVKVNATVPKNFEHALTVLAEGGIRKITFRPYFDYEIEGLHPVDGKEKRIRKKKKSEGETSKHKSKRKSKKYSREETENSGDEQQQQQQQEGESDNDENKAKLKRKNVIEISAFVPQGTAKKDKSEHRQSSKHKHASSRHKSKDSLSSKHKQKEPSEVRAEGSTDSDESASSIKSLEN